MNSRCVHGLLHFSHSNFHSPVLQGVLMAFFVQHFFLLFCKLAFAHFSLNLWAVYWSCWYLVSSSKILKKYIVTFRSNKNRERNYYIGLCMPHAGRTLCRYTAVEVARTKAQRHSRDARRAIKGSKKASDTQWRSKKKRGRNKERG